ncbi:hypothetical protein FB567DRAFT_517451 [Paraphoma chrysanthemicola]|uniref:Uncharacterized protein n=1 Tax=Paraphoma chrysanthemicola TaxID=798071 RepID=A0A8K0REY1_9PLEO|nr:hypothetical protein FB567DRAFT_517451 [Paraphoma chrysanthemicola]
MRFGHTVPRAHHMIILIACLLMTYALGSPTSNAKCPAAPICGWELMELGIPISHLGNVYAKQTNDRSQCVSQDGGKEYCTCVFECGNGVWTCENGKLNYESGCKKYCHAGECDGDGA